jgi:hypothetical protein
MQCPYDQARLDVHHFVNCSHLRSSNHRRHLKSQVITQLSQLSPDAAQWCQDSNAAQLDVLSFICKLFAPAGTANFHEWSDRNRVFIGAFSNTRASHVFQGRLKPEDRDEIPTQVSELRSLLLSSLLDEYKSLIENIRNIRNNN